jgi:hypothetical protein
MERKPSQRLYKCCELILEDIPGGGVVAKADFKNTSVEMKEGALLGVDSDGIYHLTKTAKAWTGSASGATGIKVYKNNEFKAGNILINTNKTGISRTILSVDELTSLSYDELSLEGPLNVAVNADDILVQVSAAGQTGANLLLAFPPVAVAIASDPVKLSWGNVGCGLMVRGRVKEELMPYAIDASLKAMLPLIRFV